MPGAARPGRAAVLGATRQARRGMSSAPAGSVEARSLGHQEPVEATKADRSPGGGGSCPPEIVAQVRQVGRDVSGARTQQIGASCLEPCRKPTEVGPIRRHGARSSAPLVRQPAQVVLGFDRQRSGHRQPSDSVPTRPCSSRCRQQLRIASLGPRQRGAHQPAEQRGRAVGTALELRMGLGCPPRTRGRPVR